MEKLLLQLKALADETRFAVIKMLLRHDLCVGALANRLRVSRPAVSQHMKILREAGLVSGEKRGYWMHYRVNRNELKKVAKKLLDLASIETTLEHACVRVKLKNSIENKIRLEKRREKEMCKCCCEKPEKLKGKPEDCSPEQIKECHGDTKNHPCVSKDEE